MRLDACALKAPPLDRVEGLRLAYEGARAEAVLEGVLAEFPGEVAMVSSFGAEAAVLLKMVADLDRDLPVLMIDSLLLFEETLDVSADAVGASGLAERADRAAGGGGPGAARPGRHAASARHRRLLRHPQGAAARPGAPALHGVDHRAEAVPGVDAGGARGVRGGGRAGEGQPAGALVAAELGAYMDRARPAAASAGGQGLPVDRLLAVHDAGQDGEDERAGRWRGSDKVECGIHFGADGTGPARGD